MSWTPSRYELTLSPDLDAATFTGEERVDVVVHEAVTEVVLNAADLQIHSAELDLRDEGHPLTAPSPSTTDEQRATIALDGAARPGRLDAHG